MTFVEQANPLFAVVCLAIAIWVVKLTRISNVVPQRNDPLTQIDGLRSILALAVFFHHFTIFYQWRHIGEWTATKSHFYQVLGSYGVIDFS